MLPRRAHVCLTFRRVFKRWPVIAFPPPAVAGRRRLPSTLRGSGCAPCAAEQKTQRVESCSPDGETQAFVKHPPGSGSAPLRHALHSKPGRCRTRGGPPALRQASTGALRHGSRLPAWQNGARCPLSQQLVPSRHLISSRSRGGDRSGVLARAAGRLDHEAICRHDAHGV